MFVIEEKELWTLKVFITQCIKTNRVFSYKFHIEKDLDPNIGGALLETNEIILRYEYPSFGDLVFTICHEISHDLLQHLPRMKHLLGSEPLEHDILLWNLAADHIVNTICNEILEKRAKLQYNKEMYVFLDRIYDKDMLDKMSTEVLYRFLKENTEINYSDLNGNKQGGSGESSQNQSNQESKPSGKSYPKVYKVELKDKKSGQTIISKIKVVPPNTRKRDSETQVGNYSDAWEAFKDIGSISGMLEQELDAIKNPLDLRRDLERYMRITRNGLDDLSFLKWNKKNTIIGGDIMFPDYISRTCKVVIGIDSSGSISNDEYANFIGIIKKNRKYLEGTCYVCDCEIQKKIDISSSDFNIGFLSELEKRKGYGGTSFHPVFNEASKVNDLDLLIYFTDLFAEFPKKPSRCKVLWVVKKTFDTMRIKVPYGKVIWF